MKISMIRITAVSILVFVCRLNGHSQGTFVNLDFESPVLPLIGDGFSQVPITNALPGWTGYINGNAVDRVLYNNISLGGSSVSLLDSLSPFPALVPIQGNYSVYLAAGAGIGQTGQIPNGAASLVFLSKPFSAFNVSFGGQLISMLQSGTSGNNIIMAGDISRFAGQTGELLFAGGGLFDDIQFSNQPIPEPNMLGLFGLGALLFAWRVKR